jgi:hypothetical protein
LFGYWAGVAFDARIVDGYVKAAKALDGLINQVAHVVVMAYVGADELGFNAKRTKFFNQTRTSVVVSARNDDLSAFVSEGQRRSASDPSQGPGN